MKKLVLLVILAFSLGMSSLTPTNAATPKLINYQGKLENLPVQTGPFLVVFEIFEDAAGGSALWIEQKNVTIGESGLFSTYLGETNPIDFKFDKQYYVQVTVGNNQPFPRTKLTSAPSAFYAVDADTAQYAFKAGIANDVIAGAIGFDNLAPEVLIAGGDLMGMYPNPQIKPSAILSNIPDGSITSEMLSPNISTSPSGPAGGDLTGTFPDPLIAVGAVKTDRIADGAVTNEKIVSLDASKLTNVSSLNFQVAVATDATLTGDGTVLSPLSLADNAVTSIKIKDFEVKTNDIDTAAVTTEKIADLAVTNAKVAVDAINSTNIVDGQVMTADLMDLGVTTGKVADLAITTDKLADLSVTNAKLAVDAVRVPNIDVNGGAPTDGEFLSFDAVDGEMRWVEPTVVTSAPLTGNGQTGTPVTLDPTFGNANELLIRTTPTGWVSGLINTQNLTDGAITTNKLADNSVTSIKIVDGEVKTADIADLNVTTAKINDLSVTNGKLADNSVTTLKIADGEVTTADIADLNVTSAKLADNAVITRTIADDAVTTPKIADKAVTNEKVGSGGQPSGKVMKADGVGGVTWEDDLGIILPYSGSYDGPGDAFTLTHTGLAGDGSAAVFNSTTATNSDPTVEIIKDVAAGAGSALLVRGIGVQGANYIATVDNQNLNEGRGLLVENQAPAQVLFDPGTPLITTDDYVNPDGTGTDVEDATLVLRNSHATASGQKLALKTYGSIQANSTIQGTNLVSHNGEIIVYNGANAGATLFINEDGAQRNGAADETFTFSNAAGDLDVFIEGDLDVRNQAFIGDATGDVTQTTVRGNVTPIVVAPITGTVNTISNANSDLVVEGDAALTGALTLGNLAPNSVNDIFISTDLTTVALPAPPTTVILNSNDGQLITARAVENALLNHTLQVAYNNGNTIQTNTNGNIEFSLVEPATDFLITSTAVGNDVVVSGPGFLDVQSNIINTAGPAVTVEDNLVPQANNTFDLGSDLNRWQDVYVNGTSVHVGPSGGQGANTELAVGYAANTATFTVDNGIMASLNAFNDIVTINPDAAGSNEVTIDAANNQIWLDADGNGLNEVTVDPTGSGFSVNAGTVGGNEFSINPAGLISLNSTGTGSDNLNINGLSVNINPLGDATNNYAFTESNVTLSNVGGSGDIELSDGGVNALAPQIFAFTATGGNLNVSVDGNIDVQAAASTIGDAGDIPQLTIEGTATPTTTDAAGLVSAPLVTPATTELVVQGDVQVDGSFVLGGNPVDDIFTSTDLTPGFLFPAPAAPNDPSNDGQLVTALAVQQALLAHTLQVAYNNGNQIIAIDADGDIDFNLTEATDFTINTATAANNVVIDGLGTLDAQVNIVNSATNIVTVDDNLTVTGNTVHVGTLDQQGTIANSVGAAVTVADDLDVDLTLNVDGTSTLVGAFDAQAAANTLGAGSDLTQLTVEGTATPTTTDAAGLVTASPATAATELVVQGDVQVDGSVVLGGNSVDDIFTSGDLVLGLFPAPAVIDGPSNDGQLVTALAVQQALINHDLQVAYNNGNVINATAGEGNIEFNLNGADFTLTGAAAGDDVIVSGAGILDVRVNIENATSPLAPVVLNDNFDIRGNIFNNSINATPLNITDDVTATMQDADDNFEITSASNNGNLLVVTKTAGDNGFAAQFNTNQNGIDVVTNNNNAVAYSTTLAGSNAVGYAVSTTGASAKNITSTSGGANATNVEATANGGAAIAINATANGGTGVAVKATAGSGGNAVVAENTATGATASTVTVSNTNTSANAFALTIGNGQIGLSSDNDATTAIATAGTISLTSNTIIRLNSAGVNAGNVTLGAGSLLGQTIIVTNEDAGDIFITGNVLAVYTIFADEASQFVWNGTNWIKLN